MAIERRRFSISMCRINLVKIGQIIVIIITIVGQVSCELHAFIDVTSTVNTMCRRSKSWNVGMLKSEDPPNKKTKIYI